MVFGGDEAYDDKRRLKTAQWEVHMAEPAVPRYLQWSESPITFDRRDHPYRIPHPRANPLVVELVIGSKRLNKVLMDRGRDLNIMYIETSTDWGSHAPRYDQARCHSTVSSPTTRPTLLGRSLCSLCSTTPPTFALNGCSS
jgi:hypothetical protein